MVESPDSNETKNEYNYLKAIKQYEKTKAAIPYETRKKLFGLLQQMTYGKYDVVHFNKEIKKEKIIDPKIQKEYNEQWENVKDKTRDEAKLEFIRTVTQIPKPDPNNHQNFQKTKTMERLSLQYPPHNSVKVFQKKTGFVYLRGKILKGWKKKFLVIEGKKMTFYKEVEEKKPLRVIEINSLEVTADVELKSSKYRFKIKAHLDNNKITEMALGLKSQEEAEEWVSFLKQNYDAEGPEEFPSYHPESKTISQIPIQEDPVPINTQAPKDQEEPKQISTLPIETKKPIEEPMENGITKLPPTKKDPIPLKEEKKETITKVPNLPKEEVKQAPPIKTQIPPPQIIKKEKEGIPLIQENSSQNEEKLSENTFDEKEEKKAVKEKVNQMPQIIQTNYKLFKNEIMKFDFFKLEKATDLLLYNKKSILQSN